MVAQVLEKVPALYETQKFVPTFTTAPTEPSPEPYKIYFM
jgi:hypothetical protein